jgi:endonuclease/exonuclease/phosphatase family metal-dependent hydrolase
MIKLFLKALMVLCVIVLFYFIGFVTYAWFTDFIPEKTKQLKLLGDGSSSVIEKDTISLLSWNIGYGGLGEESDFFYDGGETVTMPIDIVEKNVAGILKTIASVKHKVDFFLLQEVDVGSKRAHWIDQFEKVGDVLDGFSSSFGKNYDVEYIPIPPLDPMGRVEAGIASWSKYKLHESTRYSFEGNYEFPYHLFFLDRCFVLNRYKTTSGKDLVVINTHNSAYDDGSLKEKQLQQLQAITLQEYEKDNYVIIGGDWNQYPAGITDESKKRFAIPYNFPGEGWTCSFDPKTATNRNLIAPYDPSSSKTGLIDFFVVSPNVEVVEVKTMDQQFKYSDHHAVEMTVVFN